MREKFEVAAFGFTGTSCLCHLTSPRLAGMAGVLESERTLCLSQAVDRARRAEGLVMTQQELSITLRVQVPNTHMLTQNLYYNYYYPNPRYVIIWYLDPLGQYLYMCVSTFCFL